MLKQKATVRHKMHVRKGDTVQVMVGKDKGKVGENRRPSTLKSLRSLSKA